MKISVLVNFSLDVMQLTCMEVCIINVDKES